MKQIAYVAKHRHLFVFMKQVDTNYTDWRTTMLEYATLHKTPKVCSFYIRKDGNNTTKKIFNVAKVTLTMI